MDNVEQYLKDITKEAMNDLKQSLLDEIRRELFHDDVLISRKEAAKLLGVDLSTLWRWASVGSITPIKKGGRVFFKLSAIDAILHGITE